VPAPVRQPDQVSLMKRADAEARYMEGVRKELPTQPYGAHTFGAIAKALAADPDGVNVEALRTQLAEVTAEVERVVGAIVKVGISPALASKLQELEQRQRELRGELANAERMVALPEQAEIEKEWDDLIETLGEFTRMRPTRSQVETARASVRSYIGQMKVDRHGKGRADLQCMVAGGGFVRSHSASLRHAA